MSLIPYSLRKQYLLRAHRRYVETERSPLLDAPLLAIERLFYDRGLGMIKIVKPIFIVGCHRSGTTVLYEALAKHPELAYFTNASNSLPRAPIVNNVLSRALALDQVAMERFLKDDILFTAVTPNEGINIWELYTPGGPNHRLDEHHRDAAMDRYLREMIKKHLRYFHASRFINKNPDNSVRMRYLQRLFPDAYFIHIVRDGRAVCGSLLKARDLAREFFGPGHRHAKSGTKVEGWDVIAAEWEADPVVASGMLWRDVLATIERDRPAISPDRYVQLRYEDFVAAPLQALRDLVRFCELPLGEPVEAILADAAATLELGGRNDAWKARFSPADLDRLMPVIAPTMRRYGYDVA